MGGFPYSGADITLRTNKIGLDNFNFNLATNRFKILSSNVLYQNTAADITSLLATATNVTPIVNPSTNIFEATATAFNIPLATSTSTWYGIFEMLYTISFVTVLPKCR